MWHLIHNKKSTSALWHMTWQIKAMEQSSQLENSELTLFLFNWKLTMTATEGRQVEISQLK